MTTIPKSKKYTENVARLGFAYETIAKFEIAADWYEKLYDVDKEYEMTKDALHRASIFRESLGQYDKAIANKEEYMKAYPDDARNVGYQFDIANIRKERRFCGTKSILQLLSPKHPEGASEQSKFLLDYKYGEITKET